MMMNNKLRSTSRFALGLTLCSLFLGAYHFGAEPSFGAWLASQDDVVPVSEKISILPNARAGNIALHTGRDGVLMIDDQFLEDVPRIEAAIAALKGQAPVYLINTHWHADHTGANQHFGKQATIFAHHNVRRRLAADPLLSGRKAQGTPPQALPVVTYEQGLSLHFNGEEILLQHIPNAHTDGDTLVWFKESNVVHMGDLFFASGYPFIDVASGGNARGLIAGLHSVLEWIPADAKVIPGHGALTDVKALRSYTQVLETIFERIEELAGEGFSLEELIEVGVSEEYDAQWGGGFISPEKLVRDMFASL